METRRVQEWGSRGEYLISDAVCEQLCENCRVVRWLGKVNPPPDEIPKEEYPDEYLAPRYYTGRTYRIQSGCLLCEQIKALLPYGSTIGEVKLCFINSVHGHEFDSHRVYRGRVYDLLDITVKNMGDQESPLLKATFGKSSVSDEQFMTIPRIEPDYIDFGEVRSWLDECISNHSEICSIVHDVHVPGFKVIECCTRSIVQAPDGQLQYAALSYVWGKPQTLKNDALCFPPTIEDSIAVTVALGFRYLWVDRYVRRIITLIHMEF